MDYRELIFSLTDGVAVITLNRPEKLNALGPTLRTSLTEALKEVADNDAIRVMVLTGEGDAFCSGADVGAYAEQIKGARVEPTRGSFLNLRGTFGLAIRNLDKPTIAAVNGVAAGAGFSLALACDIRIASEKARFTLAFIKRGLVPGNGATYLLPRLIGSSRACRLAFTGDTIGAGEAERIGLVDRIVPHDELQTAAMELAQRIAKLPPIALAFTKRAIYSGMESTFESQLQYEAYAQNICRTTEDYREGVASFLEKREPVFKGR
ncbi:MAG: enoyl-CoA hydratase-related protein [Chloroflexota bacterium]